MVRDFPELEFDHNWIRIDEDRGKGKGIAEKSKTLQMLLGRRK